MGGQVRHPPRPVCFHTIRGCVREPSAHLHGWAHALPMHPGALAHMHACVHASHLQGYVCVPEELNTCTDICMQACM